MRGCGLRIEEALAVERKDFRDNGTILRVCQQATRDGRDAVPLKKRKRGEHRDIPVPTWLWDTVKDLPDGPLMPGNGDRAYQLYGTVYERFTSAAEIAGFRRVHAAFAASRVRVRDAGKGVPITDVAHWLGHRDVRVTYRITVTSSRPPPPAQSRCSTKNTRKGASRKRAGRTRRNSKDPPGNAGRVRGLPRGLSASFRHVRCVPSSSHRSSHRPVRPIRADARESGTMGRSRTVTISGGADAGLVQSASARPPAAMRADARGLHFAPACRSSHRLVSSTCLIVSSHPIRADTREGETMRQSLIATFSVIVSIVPKFQSLLHMCRRARVELGTMNQLSATPEN